MTSPAAPTTRAPRVARPEKLAATLSVLSLLPHILCCLLPTTAAFLSLGTTVFASLIASHQLAAVLYANPLYRLVDAWHTELILLAVTTTVISGVLNLMAARHAASHARLAAQPQTAACSHPGCPIDHATPTTPATSAPNPDRARAKKLFYASLILLVFDLCWYATEHFELGLHQH